MVLHGPGQREAQARIGTDAAVARANHTGGSMMSDDQRRTADRPSNAPRDLGAYIGNRPEMAEETIPGGIGPDDERVAAHDTRSSGEGDEEDRVEGRGDEWPGGHRDADASAER
jgi:hypothetical protein